MDKVGISAAQDGVGRLGRRHRLTKGRPDVDRGGSWSESIDHGKDMFRVRVGRRTFVVILYIIYLMTW